MKIASLIIGIVLMLLSGIGFIICLLLPAITNNHVSRGESMLGLIPAVIVFLLAFVMTIVSAIFVLKAKRKVA